MFYCPVNGWSCPYWNKDGTCKLDDKAVIECDDAAAFEVDLEEGEIVIFDSDGPTFL